MDRRRMMMSGKPKPLFVFTPGAPLQNYSEIKARNRSGASWGSAEDYVSYKYPNVPINPYSEVRFKTKIIRIAIPLKSGYTKLFVEAKSNFEYFNAYISWSTRENGENDNLRVILDAEKVVEFDISKRDKSGGMFYLFFQPSSWGGSYIAVTDIHFE